MHSALTFKTEFPIILDSCADGGSDGCGSRDRGGSGRRTPLKAAAEKLGKVDFANLWAGQAVQLGRGMPAAELTRALAGAVLARLSQMAR